MQDDPTIRDEELLLRRVRPDCYVVDKNMGIRRLSSGTFDDSKDGSPLSVLLTSVLAATGRTKEDALQGYAGYGLAEFSAGLARQCNQRVARTPLEEEPAHASVIGKKTKKVKSELAKGATVLILPDM
jgi:hypothetical protein